MAGISTEAISTNAINGSEQSVTTPMGDVSSETTSVVSLMATYQT